MKKQERNVIEFFKEDVARHELTILRDDGLYRHLRCQRPGSFVYQFDIVTWPGYLAYVGDMGDYVFRRLDDMFEFFGSDGINPDYWSEKVEAACDDGVREFSIEKYRECVEVWRDEVAEDMADDFYDDDDEYAAARAEFVEAVDDELLDWSDGITEEQAHSRLNEFNNEGIECSDSWEWDFRQFSWRYIWACYAITWAIGEYRKTKEVS